MALVSTYFAKNRLLAIGVAAAGSATEEVVFPVIVQQLLPKIGFGWTVRVLAFVNLGIASLTIAFLRPRLPPRTSGPLVEWAAFRDITFSLCYLSMLLNFCAVYFAFHYVSSVYQSANHVTNWH